MRFVIVSMALTGSIIGLTSCGGGGPATAPPPPLPPPPPPVSLADRFPIDGSIDLTAFATIEQRQVSFVNALGQGVEAKNSTLRWGVMNDDKDVYIALEWNDDTHNNSFDSIAGPTDFDGVKLIFDDNLNGTVDAGDDQKFIIAASVSSFYVDQHFDGTEQSDQIGDGLGRLAYDAGSSTYTAEFLIPLVEDAAGEDGGLTDSTPYNILLYDNVQLAALTGNLGSIDASLTNSGGWPRLPLVPPSVHSRARLPDGLTGLIIFISEHEVGINGEIYSFDPAVGSVTRVTNLPNLFKDNPSLSHDRSKVVFHGGPSKDDFAAYEIYTVNVDGSNLQQLTNNTILDGHPAWSPDDARLIFVSFRDVEGESLITMTTDGTEISDLTPLGFHDNDPEYLPDSRVLLKTDRFNALPEVQIAVMNEDGSGVQQVTTRTGVSDHDPVGMNGFVVFERFPKGTNFATDPESLFIGWSIVEASLTGGETTLLSDGWTNWLPVYDPTGTYVLYQKTVGAYTDIQIMSRQGQELGRLIPEITQSRYIDWK